MSEVDMKKLDVAITYVERMAEGNNPVKNVPVRDDSVLNNPNVIRCMYFIKDVLCQVRNNGGMIGRKYPGQKRAPFPLEVLSGFQYEQDKPVSYLLAQIKLLAGDFNVRGINVKSITEWMRKMEYLTEEIDPAFNQKRTKVTPKGEEFGLYMEPRISSTGREYGVVMYSQKAQEYIVRNMEAILNGEIPCE